MNCCAVYQHGRAHSTDHAFSDPARYAENEQEHKRQQLIHRVIPEQKCHGGQCAGIIHAARCDVHDGKKAGQQDDAPVVLKLS